MDGDDGSSTATDELPLLADPELPAPTGPTENDIAFALLFARRYGELLVLSRLPLDGPNTGRRRSAIFAFDSSTRDDGDGGGDPRHGDDVDADADNAAGADDDDATDDDDDNDDDDDDDDASGGFGFSYGAVPASGVAIACLPETTVGELGEERERGQCAVCLEEYEAGDALRTMPCAHCFHERCIFQWLSASRLCPLCRFPLPPEDEEDTKTDDEEDDDRRAFEYL